MKTKIVRVGNFHAVRIPKRLLAQAEIGDQFELRVENRRLVISPQHGPRHGWKEAFRAAGSSVHDELLLETAPSKFDRKQWNW
jgi:antitoxin component of MazEF toxin-antitoxin module